MSETAQPSTHQSAHHIDVKEFHPRARAAIHNPQIRQNFRKAMDGLMTKRKSAFEGWDLETLRDLGANIRLRALANLPDLLEQLEQKLTGNGIKVHWASDGDEACEIVRDICIARDAKTVIKGKSMVSEEMELNHYLGEHGIEALESDLGEYIVQLADETPSHIIMPAIHKNTGEISQLLHDKTGTDLSNDVEYLTANARLQLREKFMNADVGVSGVNFAVAETGTLCLVENEGNGRMTTTVPPCHIAVTGIEKVVPNLEDVTALLALLTRSATGQHITTYFNMISGPRKANEMDGPKEVHLVLVDNGRSTIYQDDELLDTLRCIRCGACMNHCPVYTRVGGHAYGTTYPGPIGKILMPHMVGLDEGRHLPTASSLCGACGEVCPVKIPIPDLLVRLRQEAVDGDKLHPAKVRGHGAKRGTVEAMIWKGWAWMHARPGLYRMGTSLGARFRKLQPGKLGGWTQNREDLPQLLVYDEPVESWQEALFSEVDAGITSTRGGIAETGSLILWPSVDEPRLMSLVPPIHIAVLKASELYTTFHQAMQSQNWAAGMPTNALLISGPSKTADIEQTLAYGVHGPKELIVLVIE